MADKREALQEQLAKPRSQRNIALNEKVAGLLSLAGAVVFIIAVRIGSFTSGVALAANIVCISMFANWVLIKREWAASYSGVLLVVSWLIALLVGAVFTGGNNSPIMVLAPVTPLLAALLRGRDWGWYSSITISVGIALYGAMEARGWFADSGIPPTFQIDLYEFWLILEVLVSALIGHHMSSENDQLQDTLREHARIDFLTGIPNRMSINESLNVAARESKRSSNWLSVMMLDIDFFKKFNDVNGHAAGDECLRRVAQALRATLHRPYDFVGRYGGEEFSVKLPRIDPEGAKIVAENLRKAVATLRIPYRPGKSETATIPIGVASAVASLDGEGQKLLKEADQAFYTGKELGRNRVITTVLDKSGPVDS